MTQSIPAKSKAAPHEAIRHQRLTELIEAEDAANGEVGCGRDLGNRVSGYFSTREIALEDEFTVMLLYSVLTLLRLSVRHRALK